LSWHQGVGTFLLILILILASAFGVGVRPGRAPHLQGDSAAVLALPRQRSHDTIAWWASASRCAARRARTLV